MHNGAVVAFTQSAKLLQLCLVSRLRRQLRKEVGDCPAQVLPFAVVIGMDTIVIAVTWRL
jgi:hypothetical protein